VTATLRVENREVATYVVEPQLDIRLGPRPHLHPVRTLGGVTVTDTLCFDHPWHLGASLSMADVNGHNLWGGRTFVRDEGYVWRDDHGRIVHDEWLPAPDGDIHERLRWQDGAGNLLLAEERRIEARPAPRGWRLTFAYRLDARQEVTLGSPATNGRTGGAGYGGFFWRAGEGEATAFTADQRGDVNGSAAPWVALTVGGAYTLIFEGLQGADRWFVRTGEYAGVCAALAFADPLTLAPGEALSRRVSVLVADGVLGEEDAAGLVGDGRAGIRG
jgi:Methane oxygenase PmoA